MSVPTAGEILAGSRALASRAKGPGQELSEMQLGECVMAPTLIWGSNGYTKSLVYIELKWEYPLGGCHREVK